MPARKTTAPEPAVAPDPSSIPVGGDPTPLYMNLTPAVALEWVERYCPKDKNRAKSDASIAQYKRDIQARRWDGLNGQTLTFAHDPQTGWCNRDGNHRLRALAQAPADTVVRTLVLWGVAMDAQKTNDIGRARTFMQTLSLDGESHSAILAAVLRRAVLWDRGVYIASKEKPTRQEQLEYLEANDTIRGDVVWANRHKTDLNVPASVAAFARFLLARTAPDGKSSPEAAREFLDLVVSRLNLTPSHPAHILAHRLQREAKNGRLTQDEQLALIIKAWNMQVRGVGRKLEIPQRRFGTDGKWHSDLSNASFPMPAGFQPVDPSAVPAAA